MDIIRVTDDSTRETLAAAIKALRAKQQRLPVHFIEQRDELADEIEVLVNQWLALPEKRS